MVCMVDNKKEAACKKYLGELGEFLAIKALVDQRFDKIVNLNDQKMNEKFADIICEKNGKGYAVSVKSRNKFQLSGKLNTRYNLGSNADLKAKYIAEKYDAEPYWLAV